jgi:hypothetical protein
MGFDAAAGPAFGKLALFGEFSSSLDSTPLS